jgi:uncharacterized membrane protein HdeD (DUF308 family)
VTPRWAPIAFVIFGLVSLTLGTLTLTEGDTATGVLKLALGVGWLLVAAFNVIRPAIQDGGRSSAR